jgi:hypothetical protein
MPHEASLEQPQDLCSVLVVVGFDAKGANQRRQSPELPGPDTVTAVYAKFTQDSDHMLNDNLFTLFGFNHDLWDQ